jgi:hypothetical protein
MTLLAKSLDFRGAQGFEGVDMIDQHDFTCATCGHWERIPPVLALTATQRWKAGVARWQVLVAAAKTDEGRCAWCVLRTEGA